VGEVDVDTRRRMNSVWGERHGGGFSCYL